MRKGFFILFLIAIFLNFKAHAALNCNWYLLSELRATEIRVENNAYNYTRTFFGNQNAYESAFGTEFLKTMLRLESHKTWLDIGAGQGAAQFEYIHMMQSIRREEPFTIATNVITPVYHKELEGLYRVKTKLKKHKHIDNLKAEDLPLILSEKVDVITDVFSALTYSQRPALVLFNEINQLKVGGELFIYVVHDTNLAILKNKDRFIFRDYLNSIAGIKVDSLKRFAFKITRVAEEIRVPNLQLIEHVDGNPPRRTFKLTTEVLTNK